MQTLISRKTLTAVVLGIALLAPPALPAHAADGAAPGVFGWLDAWVENVTGWLDGSDQPATDRLTAAAETDGDDPGTEAVPTGLDDGSGGATTNNGDEGPRMDPTG